MRGAVRVTQHAITRYQERVANLPDEEVRERLSCPAVRVALVIGAPYVRFASGHRAVIGDNAVITVLPADCPYWRLGTRK